jgi:hypothetical protein
MRDDVYGDYEVFKEEWPAGYPRDKVVDQAAKAKSKLSCIDEDELDIKLNMCASLGVKPLFIMRGSPKWYNYRIWQAGGYAMIFEVQIYPFGQQDLVKRIRETLGLPVDCPKAVPDGIIDRFMRWHCGRQA